MAESEPRRVLGWARAERLAWDVIPPVALALIEILYGSPTLAVGTVTLLFVVAPLVVRRRWPIPVLLIVAGAILLTASRGGSVVVDVSALVLASFAVGEATNGRARTVVLFLALAAAMSLGLLAQGANPTQSIVLPFVILVPSWLVGDGIRTWRLERAAEAQQREREWRLQMARMEAAVAEERQKIARELHDVLAHTVSVMVVQAGAARQVVRSSPEAADKALLAVEETGRQAMSELRGLLGVLEPDDEGGGLAPQPGLGQLGELVARVRDAGLPAELQIDGVARALPRTTDIAAYRIVQEALTNALRYADRARTLVHVAYEASQLRVEVLDDGPGASSVAQGSGQGIDGMRARAASAGGKFEAGPRLGGGYAVRAWLPLAEPAS